MYCRGAMLPLWCDCVMLYSQSGSKFRWDFDFAPWRNCLWVAKKKKSLLTSYATVKQINNNRWTKIVLNRSLWSNSVWPACVSLCMTSQLIHLAPTSCVRWPRLCNPHTTGGGWLTCRLAFPYDVRCFSPALLAPRSRPNPDLLAQLAYI